ncbi:hypothetical protein [Mycolicibacterium fortuitum]|uniref:hypothetical protein n=1 Tax=Mycolicibacterium fortuitum TaxID=1766 RepID=UPI001CDBDE6C|nr:hypothetical protein [Mycolicibacterium fortuitum]UBV13050.1 hypothetical protein H8Z57_19460 [Mycolicibacterium fortuitum]
MTVRSEDHRSYRDLVRVFTAALIDEAEHRDERVERLPSGELAWMVHEREFMHRLTNTARADRGLAPIGIDCITAVESSASGHTDYAGKFAMYCADLVFGEGPAS